MSNKVQVLANIVAQPLNTYNFRIDIPEINYSVLVESTTFPSQKLREVVLYFQGEAVKYPTLPDTPSPWQVTLPESDKGVVRNDFESLISSYYDQRTGLMKYKKWSNITVTACDMADNVVFVCVLHGAWCAGRESVNLSAQSVGDAWKWNYEFHYQWIEDLDVKKIG